VGQEAKGRGVTINLSPLIGLIFGAAAFIGICLIPAINWKALAGPPALREPLADVDRRLALHRRLIRTICCVIAVHVVILMAIVYNLHISVRLW
jgi:hypothetical protein